MQRSLLLYNATIRILGIRLDTLRNEIQTFDYSPLLLYKDLKHTTGLTLILPGINEDRIAFLYMQFTHYSLIY